MQCGFFIVCHHDSLARRQAVFFQHPHGGILGDALVGSGFIMTNAKWCSGNTMASAEFFHPYFGGFQPRTIFSGTQTQ